MGVYQAGKHDPVASVDHLRIGYVIEPPNRRYAVVLDQDVAARRR